MSDTSDPLPGCLEERRGTIPRRLQWRYLPESNATPLVIVATLIAVAVAEVLSTYPEPVYGMLVHAVILCVFLTIGALVQDRRWQRFSVGMIVSSLIRILSLGMPLGQFPQLLRYVLVGLPIFVAVFLATRTLQISLPSLGLRLPPRSRLPVETAVAVSGIALGVVEWQILHTTLIVSTRSLVAFIGAVLILLVFTGLLEELLFRGLVLTATMGLMGRTSGLLYTSMLFGVLHMGWHSWTEVLFAFVVGLYFGAVRIYTRSLLGVSFAHGAVNIMLFIVMPMILRQPG